MKNKSVDIYFFSGTGNTYLAAKKITETLQKNECSVNLIPIEKAKPDEIDLSKTIGLGFTIACWNTYPFVRNFYENLPAANGTEIFIFTTMGDSSLRMAENTAYILSKKGYKVIGAKGFRMPNNFINVRPHRENEIRVRKSYLQIEDFASDMLNNASAPRKTNLFFRSCYIISKFITNMWKCKISQRIMRFKTIKEKCIKCKLCFEICPSGNISYYEYPVFDKNKCLFCLRCISYCPPQAIRNRFIFKTYKALDGKEVKECLQPK
jgi:ferredoxin/flavodoxin